MPLELAPDVERAIREYATHEGKSPSDVLRLMLQERRTKPRLDESADTTTTHDDNHRTRVQNLLTQWQEECGGLPVVAGAGKTLAELSRMWQEEDE
jgi:hypothetical protein